MSNLERVTIAISAITGARTKKQYEAAKRLAAECEPACQLALVDYFIEARVRCV